MVDSTLTRRRWIGAFGGILSAGVCAPADIAFGAPGECEFGARDVIARTARGRLVGVQSRDLCVFKGVRYGHVSERFRAPRAVEAWQDVRDARAFGAACPQAREVGRTDEDCLFLNIWTPALDGRRRPVLIYVHGGGYMWGSGADPVTDGAALARRGDCVVVTLNHRLNVFGHLFLDPIMGSAFAGSGNAGLLDLVCALEWVRDEIAEFGGDPDCVTLFGQSGGGAKIATLMAMPAASGLFHRVWTMSGQQVTAQGPRAATARARAVLDALGVRPGDRDGLAAVPTRALIEALRTPDTTNARAAMYFGPVLDEVTLPRHPFWPDAPAQSAKVPMVMGNTRHETTTLTAASDASIWSLTWDSLAARLQPALFVDIDAALVIRTYRELYPALDAAGVFIAATTAGRSWRGQVIEAEARAQQGAPTWVYQLDWPSPREGGRWGAHHTLDIPLVFANTGVGGADSGDGGGARSVSAALSDALVAFARTGDPATASGPRWPRYDLARRATMIFDSTVRVENDPRSEERRLFAKVPYVQPGTF
jgi:para-nitrobenzyl esterase